MEGSWCWWWTASFYCSPVFPQILHLHFTMEKCWINKNTKLQTFKNIFKDAKHLIKNGQQLGGATQSKRWLNISIQISNATHKTRLAVVFGLGNVDICSSPRMKYHSALVAASRHQHSVWGITGPHQAAARDKQRNMFYSVTARIIKFYPPFMLLLWTFHHGF